MKEEASCWRRRAGEREREWEREQEQERALVDPTTTQQPTSGREKLYSERAAQTGRCWRTDAIDHAIKSYRESEEP